ncbi:MAG: hypothetical protein M1820_003838 [Bogoriella megaspora]|nr:MAG: hypothetical protein M1820_003838 [Bogoriella megaspora]
MPPCALLRQDCLVGNELAERLHMRQEVVMASGLFVGHHDEEETSLGLRESGNGFCEGRTMEVEDPPELSLFERIITSYPPILESLVLQLPTLSLLDLYHTSRHLRSFLSEYPLAWRSLSFRLPQPAVTIASPGNDSPDRMHLSKQNAMDDLLLQIVSPIGTRLKNLELCNTAINGVSLVSMVLPQTKGTLEHLSVRGCKNVSIKYHLVPFLQIHLLRFSKFTKIKNNGYALKSLYTYRCRHHRRRAYLPSSLLRRDSDSEPTHELIELCHQLEIWTDTAWCPTPGPRCFRRKDYYTGRAAPGTTEVWVPFDRLWRSQNRIGPNDEEPHNITGGKLWEEEEGYAGEALGTADATGEGKETPMHLRKTHKTFVEVITCDQCDAEIQERCEQCSVKMHCMGCRKTLCASCAFDRPLPRKHRKKRRQNSPTASEEMVMGQSLAFATSLNHTSPRHRMKSGNAPFWWAPGATRSPNQMHESAHELNASDSDSDSSDDSGSINPAAQPATLPPPKLTMHWCCLEPVFSGGGGVAFIGPNVAGPGADAIRAAPLPQLPEYTDPDFLPHVLSQQSLAPRRSGSPYPYDTPSSQLPLQNPSDKSFPSFLQASYVPSLPSPFLSSEPPILPYLLQPSLDLAANTCPRSLCTDCYRSFRWKLSCRACRRPICREHDLRALKVRKCGYRDMRAERDWVRDWERQRRRMEVRRVRGLVDDSGLERRGSGLAASEATQVQSSSSNLGATLAVPAPAMEASRSSHRALSPTPSPLPNFSRPRSQSLGGTRMAPLQPLPGHPQHPVQWEGCGAYFCQQFRPPGDTRPRCNASMSQCVDCGVLACPQCRANSPPCNCQPCQARYHCPSCALNPIVRAACRAQIERAQEVAKLIEEAEAVTQDIPTIDKGKQAVLDTALSFDVNLLISAINGIPEGQIETLGFMPGGCDAVSIRAEAVAKGVEGEFDEEIERMARELQSIQQMGAGVSGESSLMGSKSSTFTETEDAFAEEASRLGGIEEFA